jgi:F-type H+-transporting ATPase subunit gamma
MELIAASRIVRAQLAISAARPYAERLDEVVSELAATPEAKGHWMFSGDGEGAIVIVLGADRGLSGAFSASLVRAADELIAGLSGGGRAPAVIGIGRKVLSHYRSREHQLAQRFEGISDHPRFEDAQNVVRAVTEQLDSGAVGAIHLVSTRFLSMGAQKIECRRLVPVEVAHSGTTTAFDFEPDPSQILDRLLPRWLEAMIFSALLESAASFHVAQQRAMKAATDNAEELIKALSRAMNRARQDSITTEIVEIVGGAEALRQAGLSERVSGRPDIYVFPEAS